MRMTSYLALFARVRVEGLDDAHGPGVDHVDAVAVPAPHHIVDLVKDTLMKIQIIFYFSIIFHQNQLNTWPTCIMHLMDCLGLPRSRRW